MAWTTPRTWTDGELVTAAIMNPHIRDNMNVTMRLLARKTADQIVNNSTALVNDTHLVFAVGASDVYLINAYLLVEGGNSTADIKFGWTVPASGTIQWAATSSLSASVIAWETLPAASTPHALSNAAATAIYGTDTAAPGVLLTGIYAGGGTAGNVQLQWAQGTATVVDTNLKINSCLVGMKLA